MALIEDGRLVAQQDCSSCHAVGRDDVSPRAGAPPLRQVLESYDSGALAANLMEGIRIAHEGMPVFHISPRGVDALVEYLQYLDEESP